MSKPNGDENGYPSEPMAWTERMIRSVDSAIAFMVWVIMERKVMLDAERGFVENGESAFGCFTDEVAMHLQDVFERVLAILNGHGFDIEDVSHQIFEKVAAGMAGITLKDSIELRQWPEIIEGTDNAAHVERREAFRWLDTIVGVAKMAGVPVIQSPEGLSIPQGMLPPEVDAMLAKCMATLGGFENAGVVRDGETLHESMARGHDEACLETFEGVDIDGDDNDDDPFGGE